MSGTLRDALREEDPETRRKAAAQLGSYGGSDIAELLTSALGDADWRVRKEAVGAAINHTSSADVIPVLVDALRPGENVGLRNAAVEALAGHGEDAIRALSLAIPSLDADGRKLAVDSVARGGHPSALILLRSLIADDDPNVRVAAIEAVASVGSACASEAVALLSGCLRAPELLARLAALEGLNQLHAVVPFEEARDLLSEPMLAPVATIAAGRTGDPRAAELLKNELLGAPPERVGLLAVAFADLVESSDESQAAARAALQEVGPIVSAHLVQLRTSPDVEVRRASMVVLALVSDQAAVDAIFDGLNDEALHDAAEYAVELLGGAADLALSARAQRGVPEERALALELLARRATAQPAASVSAAIVSALDASEHVVQQAALAAAATAGGAECVPKIARMLAQSEGTSHRTPAETALSALVARYPESAQGLSEAEHGSAAVAIAIAASPLSVRGSREQDAGFLVSLLSSDSPHLRRIALDALAGLRHASALDAVSFAISDEELEVRLAAVRALGRLASADNLDEVLPQLLDLVRSDLSTEVRAVATESLGRIADARVLPVLRELLKSESAALAVAAVEGLTGRADAERSGALVDALANREPEVVKAAMRGLARPGDARAQAHLGVCLDHDNWDVRRLAADLLGRSGETGAMGLLRARLTTEREALVREALGRALESLESARGLRHTVPPKPRERPR